MKILIDSPRNIDKEILTELIDLIVLGGQVKRAFIEKGIKSADLIAIMFDNDIIVSSATLKNPKASYKQKVFDSAKCSPLNSDSYKKELGYIVTNPDYESRGYSQKLLNDFLRPFSNEKIYATTRKPAMVHILKKLNFIKAGITYNRDLKLLLYN